MTRDAAHDGIVVSAQRAGLRAPDPARADPVDRDTLLLAYQMPCVKHVRLSHPARSTDF
jgi:hypothetical protein